MQLPAFLAGVPKIVLISAVPVIAFAGAIGFTLATSGDDDGDTSQAIPTLSVQVQSNAQTTPTVVAQPTATTQPIRTDCAAIRGTDYRSSAERDWFQANCGATATAATPGTSSGSSTAQATPRPATSQNTVPSGGTQGGTAGAPAAAGGHAAGVEYVLGDQLVIPAIGVNATVTGMDVGGSGVMPDPAGYFNAVWYNFSAIPGLGGYVNGGNLVLAGHVDCARCHNGASGQAVFYSTRSLQPGAEIQYYSGGQLYRYAVFQAGSYDAESTNWAAIVAAGAADLTIITCTGTFAGGHYDQRHVVFARKIA